MKYGPLAEIAYVISGFAFKSEWFGSGIDKIIRIGDLQNGIIENENIILVDAKKFNVSSNFKIAKNDILMALSGATTGKIAVAKEKDVGSFINQRVAIIRGKTIENASYVRHIFNGEILKKLLSNADGAAQANLSPKDLANLQIPLPSLAEQRRIAELLDTADRILKLRESAIAKLDELERSVFLKLIDGSNAENEIALSEVTTNIKNISPAFLFSDQKFTYIDIGSVSNETKSIISENMIIGIDAPSRAKQEIKVNDVLVSTVRPNLNAVAKVNHSYIKPVASTGFCVLRCDTTKILPQVVFSAVKSKNFITAMVNSATGASYPAVTDKIVKSFKFPKIAMNEQLRFAEFIDTCEKKRILQNAQASKLKQLIQSLQHQSFAVN